MSDSDRDQIAALLRKQAFIEAVKRFLANEWNRAQAVKRGGGQNIVSLDEETAEGRYRFEVADHVTPISGLDGGSAGLKAAHLLFLISLANWISGVNRDRPKSYLGIGAFNLVRTAWSTAKLMEKNYFAAVDYRTGLVLAGSVFVLLVFALLTLGLFSGTLPGLAAALSPLSLILPAGILARRLGWPRTVAVCVPFMFPLFLYAVLNSTVVTLLQDGIRWRETFYALDTLRAGNVR